MAYLNTLSIFHAVLDGAINVPVGTKRPNGTPSSFIRYMLIGGADVTQEGFVSTSFFEVEAWAKTPTQAFNLLMEAHQAINNAAFTGHLRHTGKASHPSELPTGEDNYERYRMTFEIETRG